MFHAHDLGEVGFELFGEPSRGEPKIERRVDKVLKFDGVKDLA